MERLPSLRVALDAFLLDLTLEGRSPSTIRTYRSLLSPCCDGRTITALTPEACRLLIADRLTRQSRSTARTFSGALGSFCAYLTRYGVPDPMKEVPTPRQQDRPHRFLSRDQLQSLWHACPDDTYRLMLLLLMEGLRASEAVGLRWRDISGDVAQIRGKGSRYRKIVLSGALLSVLEGMEQSGETVLGYGATRLRARVNRLGRLAGIAHVHPHLVRHSFASNALVLGMDTETLRSLGGWSEKSAMLLKYTASAREQASLIRSREFSLTEKLLGD